MKYKDSLLDSLQNCMDIKSNQKVENNYSSEDTAIYK